jgi:regulator of replication initiation timing
MLDFLFSRSAMAQRLKEQSAFIAELRADKERLVGERAKLLEENAQLRTEIADARKRLFLLRRNSQQTEFRSAPLGSWASEVDWERMGLMPPEP